MYISINNVKISFDRSFWDDKFLYIKYSIKPYPKDDPKLTFVEVAKKKWNSNKWTLLENGMTKILILDLNWNNQTIHTWNRKLNNCQNPYRLDKPSLTYSNPSGPVKNNKLKFNRISKTTKNQSKTTVNHQCLMVNRDYSTSNPLFITYSTKTTQIVVFLNSRDIFAIDRLRQQLRTLWILPLTQTYNIYTPNQYMPSNWHIQPFMLNLSLNNLKQCSNWYDPDYPYGQSITTLSTNSNKQRGKGYSNNQSLTQILNNPNIITTDYSIEEVGKTFLTQPNLSIQSIYPTLDTTNKSCFMINSLGSGKPPPVSFSNHTQDDESGQESAQNSSQTKNQCNNNLDMEMNVDPTQNEEEIEQHQTQSVQAPIIQSVPNHIPPIPNIPNLSNLDPAYVAIMQTLVSNQTLLTQQLLAKGNKMGQEDRHMIPKIELSRFGGDITKWPSFYMEFKAFYLDKINITELAKLNAFRNLLDGRPKIIASNYQTGEGTLDCLLKKFKEQYGDETKIKNSFKDKLLNLPKIDEGLNNLHVYFDLFESIIHSLKLLQDDSPLDFAVRGMIKEFPKSLHEKMATKTVDKGIKDWNLANLYSFLESETRKQTIIWESTRSLRQGNFEKPKQTQTFNTSNRGQNQFRQPFQSNLRNNRSTPRFNPPFNRGNTDNTFVKRTSFGTRGRIPQTDRRKSVGSRTDNRGSTNTKRFTTSSVQYPTCRFCKKANNHYTDTCPEITDMDKRRDILKSDRICALCYQTLTGADGKAHICRKPLCFNCQEIGHRKAFCTKPYKPMQPKQSQSFQQRNYMVRRVQSEETIKTELPRYMQNYMVRREYVKEVSNKDFQSVTQISNLLNNLNVSTEELVTPTVLNTTTTLPMETVTLPMVPIVLPTVLPIITQTVLPALLCPVLPNKWNITPITTVTEPVISSITTSVVPVQPIVPITEPAVLVITPVQPIVPVTVLTVPNKTLVQPTVSVPEVISPITLSMPITVAEDTVTIIDTPSTIIKSKVIIPKVLTHDKRYTALVQQMDSQVVYSRLENLLNSSSSVILELAYVDVFNPLQPSKSVRKLAMLDNGSTSNFSLTSIMEELNLLHHAQSEMDVSAFKQKSKIKGELAAIGIKIGRDKHIEMAVTCLSPYISPPNAIPSIPASLQSYLISRGCISPLTTSPISIKIDLLIGQEYYHILTNVKRELINGFHNLWLTPSLLGPIFHGSLKANGLFKDCPQSLYSKELEIPTTTIKEDIGKIHVYKSNKPSKSVKFSTPNTVLMIVSPGDTTVEYMSRAHELFSQFQQAMFRIESTIKYQSINQQISFVIACSNTMYNYIDANYRTDIELAILYAMYKEYIQILHCYLFFYESDRAKLQFIQVEGTIGAGKTTLINYLHKHYICAVLGEKIEKWQKIPFVHSHLTFDGIQQVYDSIQSNQPNPYICLIQNYIMTTILSQILIKSFTHYSTEVRIMERSVSSAFHIFCKTHYNKQLTTPTEYNYLLDLSNTMTKLLDKHINVTDIIYLNYLPNVHLERIQARGRTCEVQVKVCDLKYQTLLHEKWKLIRFSQHYEIAILEINDSTLNPHDLAEIVAASVSGLRLRQFQQLQFSPPELVNYSSGDSDTQSQ
jgi:deoxyadenosine/deoxycytidine kinase